ncbi:MAG: hypothetical protein ACJATI_004843 [Halioglobus sp.]|jgi:hypothetical protein
MNKYLTLFCLTILTFTASSQTFLKEYNNNFDEETVSEISLSVFESNDTTILLCLEQDLSSASSVFYNLYLDNHGNQINKIYRDTNKFWMHNFQKLDEHSLIYRNTASGSLQFSIVNNLGEILHSADVDVSECAAPFFVISDILETEDRFILSGRNGSGDGAALIFLDKEFNLIDCKHTDDSFKDIPSIVQTDDGRIFGTMAFVDYEMIGCGNCWYDARFYLAEFSEDFFFDTISILYEGQAELDFSLKVQSISGNNLLIAHELEPQSMYDPPTGKLILKSINQQGNINWKINPLEINYYNGMGFSISKDENGNILFIYNATVSDDMGFEDSNVSVISIITTEGDVLWTKRYLMYANELGRTISNYYKGIFIENENYFTFLSQRSISFLIENPLLLRVTKEGCLHEDCRIQEVAGYFPPPRKMISYRNIWNIHNTETDERYRYSFVELAIPDIGGSLIRSDDMWGDNWSLTDRQFWGGNRFTSEFGPNGYHTDYQYNYEYEVGEYNDLTAPPEYDWRRLFVIDKDTIEFNDGRSMRKLTLQCYRDNDIMEEYEPITWIELLGDPNHLFDTHNACRTRGSEVVTCFYSAGDLMWSHPEYTDCAPTGVEELDGVDPLLYPNPSQNMIQLTEDFGAYRIVSTTGQILKEGKNLKAGAILDVSDFPLGNYYIYEVGSSQGRRVIPFSKY